MDSAQSGDFEAMVSLESNAFLQFGTAPRRHKYPNNRNAPRSAMPSRSCPLRSRPRRLTRSRLRRPQLRPERDAELGPALGDHPNHAPSAPKSRPRRPTCSPIGLRRRGRAPGDHLVTLPATHPNQDPPNHAPGDSKKSRPATNGNRSRISLPAAEKQCYLRIRPPSDSSYGHVGPLEFVSVCWYSPLAGSLSEDCKRRAFVRG